MFNGYSGILRLVVLALGIWAVVSVAGSGAFTAGKVIWILAILILLVLGFLAWLLVGPPAEPRRA